MAREHTRQVIAAARTLHGMVRITLWSGAVIVGRKVATADYAITVDTGAGYRDVAYANIKTLDKP